MMEKRKISRWSLLFFGGVVLLLAACGRRLIVDDTTKETGLHSSLVLDDNGVPLIAYFDKSERMIKLAVCADAKCSDYTLHIVDDEGATGQYPSITLNNKGNPVISYYDMSKKSLKLAVCKDRICSDVHHKLLEDETSSKSGEYGALRLNSEGFPIISHYDSKNKILKIAVCKDVLCDDYAIIVVDDEDDVGKSTSLVLTDEDFPIISYFDEANAYLKIAICEDTMCTDPVRRTFVSDKAESGEFNSLALNTQGHPVISYQYHNDTVDPAVGALKLILCQDPFCMDAVSSTVDEQRGSAVGEYNAMVLNSEGYPVIAYWDTEARAVKVATCKDETCKRASIQKTNFDWGLQFISLALNENDKAYVSCYEVRPNKKRLVLIKPNFP